MDYKRLNKGAIVSLDLADPLPKVIAFQYNPATLTRNVQTRKNTGADEAAEGNRLSGAPVETLSVEIELDATEESERNAKVIVPLGLHPQLAALEMLLYPPSETVSGDLTRLGLGMLQIVPPEMPLTVFVYGPNRILPVQLTDLSIVEEMHDPWLNPLQAKVSLSMRVLSYNDLLSSHAGHKLFLAHQVAKEGLAAMAGGMNVISLAKNLSSVVSSDVRSV